MDIHVHLMVVNGQFEPFGIDDERLPTMRPILSFIEHIANLILHVSKVAPDTDCMCIIVQRAHGYRRMVLLVSFEFDDNMVVFII